MQVQNVNNQIGFNAITVIPKNGAQHYSANSAVSYLTELTNNLKKNDRDYFIKNVINPLNDLKTNVLFDFNKETISILQNEKPVIKLDNRIARVIEGDERVALYPINDVKFYGVLYETTSDAESAVWKYNFLTYDVPLISKAYAAVDIATKLG